MQTQISRKVLQHARRRADRLKRVSIMGFILLIPVAAYSLVYSGSKQFLPAPIEAAAAVIQTPAISEEYSVVAEVPKSSLPMAATPSVEDTPIVEDKPWYTEQDVELMAAVISAESRGEIYEGQLAVGSVILNRLDCGYWGDTLQEVLYSESQFAEPHWSYGDSEYQAALECLEGKSVLPPEVLFFQVAKMDSWYGAEWYCSIGNHNFYTKEGLL